MSRLGDLRSDWLKALFAASQIGKSCPYIEDFSRDTLSYKRDYLISKGYLWGLGYHSICSACKYFYIDKSYYGDVDAGCEHPMNDWEKYPRMQRMIEAASEGSGSDCWAFRSGKSMTPREWAETKGLTWEEVESVSVYRDGFAPDFHKQVIST